MPFCNQLPLSWRWKTVFLGVSHRGLFHSHIKDQKNSSSSSSSSSPSLREADLTWTALPLSTRLHTAVPVPPPSPDPPSSFPPLRLSNLSFLRTSASSQEIAHQADLCGHTAKPPALLTLEITNPGTGQLCVWCALARGNATQKHLALESASKCQRWHGGGSRRPWQPPRGSTRTLLSLSAVLKGIPQGRRRGYSPHLSPGSKGFCCRRHRWLPPSATRRLLFSRTAAPENRGKQRPGWFFFFLKWYRFLFFDLKKGFYVGLRSVGNHSAVGRRGNQVGLPSSFSQSFNVTGWKDWTEHKY